MCFMILMRLSNVIRGFTIVEIAIAFGIVFYLVTFLPVLPEIVSVCLVSA